MKKKILHLLLPVTVAIAVFAFAAVGFCGDRIGVDDFIKMKAPNYENIKATVVDKISKANFYNYNCFPNHRKPVAPVPEPMTMLLVGSGLVGLAAYRRKHKK